MFPNTNCLWSAVIAEVLVRKGITRVVISPGSRSTPLTYAFSQHAQLDVTPVLDERSAGFFALGMAKCTCQPVALVCTSGSAAANYFPAIVEAAMSDVPLIVLTADRPAELRDCFAGQTIDQQKLFGDYVRFYHEVALPSAAADMLRYVRQTVGHACDRAIGHHPGPVHLNVPFRDPLAPVSEAGGAPLPDVDVAAFCRGMETRPPGIRDAVTPPPVGEAAALLDDWRRRRNGVIIAGYGACNSRTDVDDLAALAADLGWPLLADPLSQVRTHADRFSGLVTNYDAIARNGILREALAPEFCLCVGQLPISKPLRAWLGDRDIDAWAIEPHGLNRDPLHLRTRQVRLPLSAFPARHRQPSETAFRRDWLAAERTVMNRFLDALGRCEGLFEGTAVWLLSSSAPEESCVMLANSMFVRDAEYFWQPDRHRYSIFCNRGANGIDGTLSSALGIAQSADRPTYLLTGDLAFLHDTNGLLSLSQFTGSLTVVIVDNAGGGIFEALPVATFDPPFERLFATPQAVDFAKLVAAYDAEYIAVADAAAFVETISHPPGQGVRIVHIKTNRKTDMAWRKTLFSDIAENLHKYIN